MLRIRARFFWSKAWISAALLRPCSTSAAPSDRATWAIDTAPLITATSPAAAAQEMPWAPSASRIRRSTPPSRSGNGRTSGDSSGRSTSRELRVMHSSCGRR